MNCLFCDPALSIEIITQTPEILLDPRDFNKFVSRTVEFQVDVDERKRSHSKLLFLLKTVSLPFLYISRLINRFISVYIPTNEPSERFFSDLPSLDSIKLITQRYEIEKKPANKIKKKKNQGESAETAPLFVSVDMTQKHSVSVFRKILGENNRAINVFENLIWVYHIMVVVDDITFEYNQRHGLLISDYRKRMSGKHTWFKISEDNLTTSVSPEELTEHIKKDPRWTCENYRVLTCNCQHFIGDCLDFLKVDKRAVGQLNRKYVIPFK